MMLNTTNWQGTGVINDIPTPAPDTHSGVATPSVYQHEKRTERETSAQDSDEFELGRAAQYALREVLDSIEAAK